MALLVVVVVADLRRRCCRHTRLTLPRLRRARGIRRAGLQRSAFGKTGTTDVLHRRVCGRDANGERVLGGVFKEDFREQSVRDRCVGTRERHQNNPARSLNFMMRELECSNSTRSTFAQGWLLHFTH